MDVVLGIDIAKAKFDVTLQWPDGRRRRKSCRNTPSGFAELTQWLTRQQVRQVHAGLEATGAYGDALATFLYDAGHQVSVLNPATIHHYAQSRLARTKTDALDADLIADYVATQHPAAWAPLPPEVRELQALVRRLDVLIGMQTEERNRRQAGALVPAVRDSIETLLASLDAQIAHVRRLLRDHIDHHPHLRDQRDLLTSIPGIGEATAAALLAELFTKSYTSARQAAAFAGLVPRVHDSGTLRRPAHLSKTGPARLRKALYFPAIAAVRFNPLVRALSDRLRAAGKPKMLVIGAAMRKLVHLAYGVLKSGRPFQATAPLGGTRP